MAASWTVPTLHCTSEATGLRIYAGLSSAHDSVRLGVAASCSAGKAVYNGFFGWAGRRSMFGATISGGDVISVTMDQYRGSVEIELDDVTSGWGEGESIDGTGGPIDNVAAVGVALNGRDGQMLPLADFGSVPFTDCTVNGRDMSGLDTRRIQLRASDGTLLAATQRWQSGGAFTVTHE